MSEIKITDNRGKNKYSLEDLTFKQDEVSLVDTHSRTFNILEEVEHFVNEEIRRCDPTDEKYGYMLSLAVVPGQDGQPMPVFYLMMEVKSFVLGQKIQVGTFIPVDADRERSIKTVVPELVKSLQEQKDQTAEVR